MHAYSHIIRWVAAKDNCFALTGAHHHGIIIRSMNGANLCLKDPLLPGQLLWVQLLKLEKAHIHQPRSWPVPHACACVKPYHAGSGSHGQLFHHRVKEQRKLVSLIAAGRQSIPLSTSSTQQDPGTAVFPPHTGKSDHGLVYACPLLYVCLMKMVN